MDNLTKNFGAKPTTEQIKEMPKFKGNTYQRRDSLGTSKSKHYPLKVTTPLDSDNVGLDLGTWFSKAKVSVLASEIVKIPEQREKLLKVLNAPSLKKVIFKKSLEEPPPTQNNVLEYPIVVLHTMDSRKEDHPPFYVSLMMGYLLLHNCMLDLGSSSNIMTRKVME